MSILQEYEESLYKDILFKTEMISAILDDNKTKTRRPIKPQPRPENTYYGGLVTHSEDKSLLGCVGFMKSPMARTGYDFRRPRYKVGDILWVRETWAHILYDDGEPCDRFVYKASDEAIDFELTQPDWKWRPSIHMPKAAARIFLCVTDRRAERLQEITDDDVKKEGIAYPQGVDSWASAYARLWDSTLKPADKPYYGWNANPWVWVYGFKKTDKPKDWEK